MKNLAIIALLVFYSLALDPKKGVGCPDSCTNPTLAGLDVSWYYNWNSYTNLTNSYPFIPMCYSGKQSRIDALPEMSDYLLGFNEPDNSNQANMAVDTAYNLWSTLVGKCNKIASPATAGNPATPGSWL